MPTPRKPRLSADERRVFDALNPEEQREFLYYVAHKPGRRASVPLEDVPMLIDNDVPLTRVETRNLRAVGVIGLWIFGFFVLIIVVPPLLGFTSWAEAGELVRVAGLTLCGVVFLAWLAWKVRENQHRTATEKDLPEFREEVENTRLRENLLDRDERERVGDLQRDEILSEWNDRAHVIKKWRSHSHWKCCFKEELGDDFELVNSIWDAERDLYNFVRGRSPADIARAKFKDAKKFQDEISEAGT